MNITISTRHFELTPAIDAYAKNKFDKVWKHFDVVSAHLRFTEVDGGAKKANADIHIKGKDVHISATEDDLYAAIDKLAQATHMALGKIKERRASHAP